MSNHSAGQKRTCPEIEVAPWTLQHKHVDTKICCRENTTHTTVPDTTVSYALMKCTIQFLVLGEAGGDRVISTCRKQLDQTRGIRHTGATQEPHTYQPPCMYFKRGSGVCSNIPVLLFGNITCPCILFMDYISNRLIANISNSSNKMLDNFWSPNSCAQISLTLFCLPPLFRFDPVNLLYCLLYFLLRHMRI